MRNSDQFDDLMRLPHRRHAFGVNAPALFRHIGFRVEEHGANPLAAIELDDNVALRDQIIARINDALHAIQDSCGAKHKYGFCSGGDRPGTFWLDRSHTLLNTLHVPAELLGHWRARIRVDVYSEYYFITLILDQERTAEYAETEIAAIERKLTESSGTDTESFLTKYYEDIWTRWDTCVGEGLSKLPGKRFTEFRGIALRDLKSPFRRRDKAKDALDDSFKIPQLDKAIVEESRNSLRAWLDRNEAFVSEVMQLKHFAGPADRDANCVLCELLDGAAIYCSSARQALAEADAGPSALRYFILYNGLSKYQLGRLIRRAHLLGELRCAAVLDDEELEKASLRIRTLGNRIDDLLRQTPGSTSAWLKGFQLKEVQMELNSLAFSDIPGGLLYRVNRSRYYAELFQQRVKEMRTRRLEGWQTYDDFFHRNLYPRFDEIDGIGHRYDAIAERVNRLTNARNAERLNEFQTTMLHIQKLGEVIGLAAFTYYGGHILADAATGLFELMRKAAPPHLEIYGFVVALFTALTLFYWFRKAKPH